jgi:hypothetical protein
MPNEMKIFIYAIIAIVAAATIGGFFVVGTPQEERFRRFDEQRVGNLQSIQWEIINYWQSKGKLPEQLSDLNDDLRGFRVPQDPEKAVEYGYEVRGAESFALCADFSLPTDSASQNRAVPAPVYSKPIGVSGEESWSHSAGRICFERTIDKEFFPPKEKLPTKQ